MMTHEANLCKYVTERRMAGQKAHGGTGTLGYNDLRHWRHRGIGRQTVGHRVIVVVKI
jgi:hypothetical protein